MLKLADVKVGTKKAIEFEHVYVLALRDVGIQIPAAVDMMLLSGRSVAGYKPTACYKPSTKTKYDIGKRVQLGYDHGEDVD
jgi:hypothetical protein